MTALSGPSGSGKTTLLSIAGGIVKPTDRLRVVRRAAHVAGRRRPAPRGRVRAAGLRPGADPVSARENVAIALRARGARPASADERADEALARFHIGDLGDRQVEELSGGQMQRVACARAFAVSPRDPARRRADQRARRGQPRARDGPAAGRGGARRDRRRRDPRPGRRRRRRPARRARRGPARLRRRGLGATSTAGGSRRAPPQPPVPPACPPAPRWCWPSWSRQGPWRWSGRPGPGTRRPRSRRCWRCTAWWRSPSRRPARTIDRSHDVALARLRGMPGARAGGLRRRPAARGEPGGDRRRHPAPAPGSRPGSPTAGTSPTASARPRCSSEPASWSARGSRGPGRRQR